MESLGAISEMSWNFPDESEVLMAQLLDANYPDHVNEQHQEATFWSGQGTTGSFNFLDNLSSCWPPAETNNASTFFFSPSEIQSYGLCDASAVLTAANSLDYFTSEEQMSGHYNVEDLICSKDEPNEIVANQNANAKRKFVEPENGIPTDQSPKKKARATIQAQKNGKKTLKGQKNAGNVEDALSNSSCSSEEESIISQEPNECENSRAKGKTRAGRGSATDPQSLYARKRRERINERLRILQNLVPNGTKVDISTMLEEAVQYVNFLQLQIKLLSSDDLWMYAPLAYNGMDIGLDLKIPLPQK